jgi:hypothetical protein
LEVANQAQLGEKENLSGNFSVGERRETSSDAAMTERFSTFFNPPTREEKNVDDAHGKI